MVLISIYAQHLKKKGAKTIAVIKRILVFPKRHRILT